MSERGIYGKYIIQKADGSRLDPEACYFVLRLDTDRAARIAMAQYARSCRKENPTLADDIERCLEELSKPVTHGPFSDVWRAGESEKP